MIKLNDKTQQDFLNREWVKKLLDAGVDMSDAKYALYRLKDATIDIVIYQGTFFDDDRYYNGIRIENIIPTYTASELLNKLIDNKTTLGGLRVNTWEDNETQLNFYTQNKDKKFTLKAVTHNPIESLASLLLQRQYLINKGSII